MSVNRTCPNCFRVEGIRANFGNDREAERAFHQQIWCSCGYSSPEQMMRDQDMGFDDPRWLRIAKYFIENYHLRLKQGEVRSEEELVRFFLRLLKSSASNVRTQLVLESSDGSDYEFVYHGRTAHVPQADVFSNDMPYDFLRIRTIHQSHLDYQAEKVKEKTKYLLVAGGVIAGLIAGIMLG